MSQWQQMHNLKDQLDSEMVSASQDEINNTLRRRYVIHGFRGSVAHNLYVPDTEPNSTDDVDTMGVVVPDLSHYFGFYDFGSRGTFEYAHNQWDIVVYEITKFLHMLSSCNPSALTLLWLRPEFYIDVSQEGDYLIHRRGEFMFADGIYNAFCGYAKQQLGKMDEQKFQGYMGTKRKQLVEQHGYDTRSASHCIRLFKMGKEALETGNINVYRDKDREALLDIKNGVYSRLEIREMAADLFEDVEYARKHSVLKQERIDRDTLNAYSVSIIKSSLRMTNEI